MKNVYFVQANISCNSVRSYLPYAVGCIIAYAWQYPEIAAEYSVADIFFMRETPEQLTEKISEPYLVALSCNTWNAEYDKAVAKCIKAKYPECKILFGGHNVTEDTTLIEECDYVDYFIYGEGEEPFYQLLTALHVGNDLSVVENLIYRENGMTRVNAGRHERSIENYPSPYLTGVFDTLIEEYPQIEFNITTETNRGCPYDCTYCDWTCSSRVRCFSMERIKCEIDWMALHKITYCMPGDANFGIVPRDVEIAEYIVKAREKTGYPEIFKPCYAKDSIETVFKAGCLLNAGGADKGVTISCQSMSSEVLKNIKRCNVPSEQFRQLVSRFADVGIPTYTELIVGLPGETYDSFCYGVCETIESGQHNSLSVYMCNVYPGSPLNKADYRKRFGIKTVHIPLSTAHFSPDYNGIPEYYDVVTETASMPFDDWVKANVFAIAVQCFHHMGLLRCFAIYLRNVKNISYLDFYTALLNYIYSKPGSLIYKYFETVRSKLSDTQTADWTYCDSRFSSICWFFDEGAFLEFLYSGDRFWSEIEPFLNSFGLDSELFNELFNYQRQILRLPGEDSKEIVCGYDFYSYFAKPDCQPPKKKRICLDIRFEKHISDWKEYAREIIWFGKRRSATLVTNPREHVECNYP